MDSPWYPLFALVALASATWLGSRLVLHKRRLPLPAGPPGAPLIGNLLNMPKGRDWLTYAAWAKTYGDIISYSILGQTIIILNSPDDVKELFVTRAANYSDRIRNTMVQLTAWGDSVGTVSPGENFRKMRRFTKQLIGSRAIKDSTSVQEKEVEAYIRRILARPEDLYVQSVRLVGSVILRLTYGYEVRSDDDPFVVQAQSMLKVLHMSSASGWIVDRFPLLLYLPTWLPGMAFKRQALAWRKVVENFRNDAMEWTRRQIESGKTSQCFAADLLADDEHMEDETLLLGVLGDLSGAAVDSTLTGILNFFLLMALHPDAQKSAQAEIDSITNGERMPVYDDLAQMPYVRAVIKEMHRWHPVGPIGLPRCVADDDCYKGYTIPKGAIIFANIWSILHNPDKHPDPAEFKPERHLGGTFQTGNGCGDLINEDPERYDFGFGTRECPGRHLAQSMLFLTIARVLATCEISDAVDARTGVPLTPDTAAVEFQPGIISQPAPFNVSIRARPTRAESLVNH